MHIRYEDDVTVASQPFALGITVESLTAQSCDDNWMPKFMSWESGGTMFKLMELQALAVYWDMKADLLGDMPLGELAVRR